MIRKALLVLLMCAVFGCTINAKANLTQKMNGITYLLDVDARSATVTAISNTSSADISVEIPAEIVIESIHYSVTVIGDGANSCCQVSDKYGRIIGVKIPESVTKIADLAFYDSLLESVTIGAEVTYIGRAAFSCCDNLTCITIETNPDWDDNHPSLVIDNHAFVGSPICSITLNRNISPRDSATMSPFSDNPNLKEVVLGEQCTYLSSYLFANCINLSTIQWSNNLTDIQRHAFENCSSLTELLFPGSLKTIGAYAFNKCKNLSTIQWSNNLTDIGEYAFENCNSLTELLFPGSLKTIGAYAFSKCKNLKTIQMPKYSVRYLGDYAFSECELLQSVTIPNSIEDDYIGEYVFSGCKSLNSINLGYAITTIPTGMFSGCESLVNIEFPEEQILRIGEYAFRNCKGIKELDIKLGRDFKPEIGNYAFENCISLKKLTVGNTSRFDIGSGAFQGCTNLDSIDVYSADRLCAEAFSNCTSLKHVELDGYGGHYSCDISGTAFENCPIETLALNVWNSNTSTLPFREISTIKRLAIGDRVKIIRLNEFEAAKNTLQVLTIGNDQSIDELKICDSFEVDSLFCLRDIVYLDDHEFPSDIAFGLAKVRKYFYGVAKAENICAGSSLEKAVITSRTGKGAFSNCTNLKYLTFDEVGWDPYTGTFSAIGERAFEGCPLAQINVYKWLPDIDPSSFDQLCYDNATVYGLSTNSSSEISDRWSDRAETKWNLFKHLYEVKEGRARIWIPQNTDYDIREVVYNVTGIPFEIFSAYAYIDETDSSNDDYLDIDLSEVIKTGIVSSPAIGYFGRAIDSQLPNMEYTSWNDYSGTLGNFDNRIEMMTCGPRFVMGLYVDDMTLNAYIPSDSSYDLSLECEFSNPYSSLLMSNLDLEWSCDDESIASVTASGSVANVKILKPDCKATISVTATPREGYYGGDYVVGLPFRASYTINDYKPGAVGKVEYGQPSVSVENGTIIIQHTLPDTPVSIYSVEGSKVFNAYGNGDTITYTPQSSGVYIVKYGYTAIKVLIK